MALAVVPETTATLSKNEKSPNLGDFFCLLSLLTKFLKCDKIVGARTIVARRVFCQEVSSTNFRTNFCVKCQ